MNIKFSTFQSRLTHSPDFNNETEKFIADIEKSLCDKLHYADLADYDCDVKLIFVQTGGSEGYFLNSFDKLQEPYYILTNGSNNSLAASLEILTYLNNRGIKGEILHGGAEYIAERIKTLAAVNKVKRQLKSARLGVIGQPSNWLISSVPDYGDVLRTLGVTLVNIPISRVEEISKNAVISSKTDCPDFDREELTKARQIQQALEQIVCKERLNGLTIRCFDLLTSLKSTGCLALAELYSKGIIGTCEGDIAAMLSMLIARIISGKSNFQANPSRIDVSNNTVVFAHCTAPLDMLDEYKFDTHFESGIGVAVKGELHAGKATVFRLSADLKRYFVSSCDIVKNLSETDLCRTQIAVRLDEPVTQLLTTPCGNHHIIMYGDYTRHIKLVMNSLLG